jgi:hypothetical protein
MLTMDGSGLHKEGSTLLQAGSTLLCAGSILLEVGSKHQQVTASSRRIQQTLAGYSSATARHNKTRPARRGEHQLAERASQNRVMVVVLPFPPFFHNTHALQLLPNSCFSGINMHAEMNSSIGLGLNILNQRVFSFSHELNRIGVLTS